ncbi:Uncharacterised protein [Segatella buccae]|uniref:Uncharacterized protein n=1 Tax=Segatella buccae TaxID=28126 RepID=A0AAQ1UI92_9BACT|nr:Uncharacterised protein [Segatella buccae]
MKSFKRRFSLLMPLLPACIYTKVKIMGIKNGAPPSPNLLLTLNLIL